MQSRHLNYLEMSVQFTSNLLPAQEVGKLVIVSMKSHSYCGLSDLALLAVYKIPRSCSVDSGFLKHFAFVSRGKHRQKEMWTTYIVRAGN